MREKRELSYVKGTERIRTVSAYRRHMMAAKLGDIVREQGERKKNKKKNTAMAPGEMERKE
jgi:hypothetical protein